MKDIVRNENFENGSVNISEDVISTISNLAVLEVDGVSKMSTGGLTGEISEMLGMKGASKGVAVKRTDRDLIIDVFIAVKSDVKINDVGVEIQKNVKETVETMTGLDVVQVNVNVQEVNYSKKNEEKIKKED